MAYDADLADRIRELLALEAGVEEKRMFGGLAFLLDGHMAAAASGQGGLMLRVAPDRSAELVRHAGVERMVMKGRELDGWLRVADAAITTDEALRSWLARGVEYVRSLPPK